MNNMVELQSVDVEAVLASTIDAAAGTSQAALAALLAGVDKKEILSSVNKGHLFPAEHQMLHYKVREPMRRSIDEVRLPHMLHDFQAQSRFVFRFVDYCIARSYPTVGLGRRLLCVPWVSSRC
jgi:hypothetical protein